DGIRDRTVTGVQTCALPIWVLDALANNLTPGDNWRARLAGPIVTPGVADTEFTVEHRLGIVPTYYIWNVDKGAVVYDSRRSQWKIGRASCRERGERAGGGGW